MADIRVPVDWSSAGYIRISRTKVCRMWEYRKEGWFVLIPNDRAAETFVILIAISSSESL